MSSISQPPLPPSKFYLDEDDLTQGCRNLLSTLPKEKGWVCTHLYQYLGFWHTSMTLQAMLACQRHFKAQATDILLATSPKSGTTWLKALMFALLNRKRYPNADEEHPLLKDNPHTLVPFLENRLYIDNQEPDLSSFISPRVFATHMSINLLPSSVKDSECKLVYLCRNPRDVFVSMWHFTNKIRPKHLGNNSLEEMFDMFCRGVTINGPFWDHVLGYWEESLRKPKKVLFLKYEEMKESPSFYLRKLAEFIGCPFSLEEEAQGVVEKIVKMCSFEKLSNLEVNKNGKLSSGEDNNAYYRRGQVGDWNIYLTAEMVDRLDRITEQKFNGTGLKL